MLWSEIKKEIDFGRQSPFMVIWQYKAKRLLLTGAPRYLLDDELFSWSCKCRAPILTILSQSPQKHFYIWDLTLPYFYLKNTTTMLIEFLEKFSQ